MRQRAVKIFFTPSMTCVCQQVPCEEFDKVFLFSKNTSSHVWFFTFDRWPAFKVTYVAVVHAVAPSDRDTYGQLG